MNSMTETYWEDTFSVIRLKGSGTRSFLHGQTSVDLLTAKEDTFIKACYLTTSGFVNALIEIVLNNDGAEILVLQGNAQSLFDDFDHVIFPADQVKIDSIYQIRRIQEINFHSSWKENQVAWIKGNDLIPKFFQSKHLASSEQFEEWRLKQGLPFFSNEISGETNPLELGLLDLISLNKGCYLGQETIARLIRSGSASKKLRYWESNDHISSGAKLTQLNENSDEKNKRIIGVITSSSSMKFGGSFGLALIRNHYLQEKNISVLNCLKKISLINPIGFCDIDFKDQ